MKVLISLMLMTSLVGAQEVRQPQRGEERREPTRIERPEPVRSHPSEAPPRVESRPTPSRPDQPRPTYPIGNPTRYDPRFQDPMVWRNPWFMMQMDFYHRQRMERNRRPRRVEGIQLRQRWESLNTKQQNQIIEARKEFRQKVKKIIANP